MASVEDPVADLRAWVNTLSGHELKIELETRGLSSAGIIHVLRTRLAAVLIEERNLNQQETLSEAGAQTGLVDQSAAQNASSTENAFGSTGLPPDPATVPSTGTLPKHVPTGNSRTTGAWQGAQLQSQYEDNTVSADEIMNMARRFSRLLSQGNAALGRSSAAYDTEFNENSQSPRDNHQSHNYRNTQDNSGHQSYRWSNERHQEYRHEPRYTSRNLDTFRRLKIEFSGKPGQDPESFLSRLDEARAVLRLPDPELFECLPFGLEGVALEWYRDARQNWTHYAQFVAAFRRRYGTADLQIELYDEISRRTQGKTERVLDFLTCVKAMLRRLDPPLPFASEISLTKRLLLPEIQAGLPYSNIRTFTDLENVAYARERSLQVMRTFRPPPTPEESLLPDLAYRRSSRSNPETARTPARRLPINNLDSQCLDEPGNSILDVDHESDPRKTPKSLRC